MPNGAHTRTRPEHISIRTESVRVCANPPTHIRVPLNEVLHSSPSRIIYCVCAQIFGIEHSVSRIYKRSGYLKTQKNIVQVLKFNSVSLVSSLLLEYSKFPYTFRMNKNVCDMNGESLSLSLFFFLMCSWILVLNT